MSGSQEQRSWILSYKTELWMGKKSKKIGTKTVTIICCKKSSKKMVHQNVFCCKPVSWNHKLVEIFHLCSVMFQNIQKEGGNYFLNHIHTTPVNIFPEVQTCGNGLTQ
jgi:hypothetical protein